MVDSISIRVTAEVTDLQAKFAISRAETQALSRELNNLAKTAATTGLNDTLKSQMLQVSEQLLNSKNRTAELGAQLRTASGDVRAFSGSITQAESLLGQFGVALSVAGVVAFARSIVAAGADIQRQADALDTSVESYQAFQFAAREAGVDVDESGGALKRFAANLGELQTTGEGPLAKDLAAIGLTADELAGDPLQALITFARALDAEKDATIRAAVERAAFGRSGVDLTALMHKLAEGEGDVGDKLEELKNKAREAGQMMDSTATEGAKHFDEAIEGLVTRAKAGVAALGELIAQDLALDQAENEGIEIAKRLAERRQQPANTRPSPQGLPSPPAPTFLKPQIPNVPEPSIEIAKAGGGSNKGADDARRIADEEAQAWEHAQEQRIAGEEAANRTMLDLGQQTLEQYVSQARDLENQRYSIALEGLHKREQADAGNKVALAKDQADEQVLAQEHSNKLAAIDQEYQRQKRQIDETELADFIDTKKRELDEEIKHLDASYKAGAISSQEKHDLEHALTGSIEQEVLKRFDADHAALVKGTEVYAQAMKERRALVDGFTQHVEQQDDTLAKEQAEKWIAANREIISAESTFISGFLGGRQTLGQAALQAFEQLLEKELTADFAYWTERGLLAIAGVGRENAAERGGFLMNLLFNREKTASTIVSGHTEVAATAATEAQKTAVTTAGAAARNAAEATENTSFIGRIASWLGQWLGFETTKTAATVSQSAARDASAAAETATTIASAKAQALAEIPAYTGIAAMEAASAVAAIPFVGPVLAAAAAAEMNALGASELALASAAGGDWMVNAGLYQLHPREMVIPANIADPMREVFSRGAAGAFHGVGARNFDGSIGGGISAGADGGDVHTHVHLDGMTIVTPGPDAMKLWLGSTDGKRAVTRAFREAARAGIKPRK